MTYCDGCDKNVETKIINKKQTFNVCGEDIEIDAPVLVCVECGEELFSEELDSETLNAAFAQYRKNHKLLLPEEIKGIREQYGLSQRSFAKLLNWGDKTIRRYENGAIQDKAHNSMLMFLRDPQNMKKYLAENEVTFDEKQVTKLLATIENLEANDNYMKERNVMDLFFSKSPCEENGFKGFDYDKLCAMVLFFSNKCPGLLKTKLMKLLNYSDMIYYKENAISISGLKYKHLPYGPVPIHFDVLLDMMASDKVAHIEVTYDHGYEKHQVMPDSNTPFDVFSEDELETLEKIFEKFKDYGSIEISNYSHEEKGYKSTKQGEIISYSYAKDIILN